MVKGNIFNIQKFSIHDGPGIRTTVFLKGCPLQCLWCSNPESQLEKVQILYDEQKCVHCLNCVNSCPQKAIENKNNHIHIHFNKCVGCLQCVHNCYQQALSHEGEYKDVDEVVRVCLQDQDFYEESDGGVTISGGEGMSQPVFVKALITELKNIIFMLQLKQLVISNLTYFKNLLPYLIYFSLMLNIMIVKNIFRALLCITS